MPGGTWQSAADSLCRPAFDYYVARRTVGVPIAEDGALLVDALAVAGAAEVLVEVAPGQFRHAELGRTSTSARQAVTPLAVVRIEGVTFTPVAVADPAVLAKDQKLTLYAHSLPAELDPGAPRRATLTVTGIDEAGTPTFDQGLRPGESGSPLLTEDGQLAAFLLGRIDPMADGGGPMATLPTAELAKFVKQATRSTYRRSGYSSSGRLTRKDVQAAPGRVFTVYILTGVGGPEKKK
jgi:hypothetical protein